METIELEISNGEKAKFTIIEKSLNGEIYYSAYVIGTEIEFYKNLSPLEKQTSYGMQITNGKGKHVYYKEKEILINDLKTKYGVEWLEGDL